METKLFGTDGIRKKVGESPLTENDMFFLGKAISQWTYEKHGKTAEILVAHDTRKSSYMLKSALKSGLTTHIMSVFDLGVLPTPAVASIMDMQMFNCSVIITASHNPHYDNGIKIIDLFDGKLNDADEKRITDLFYRNKKFSDPSRSNLEQDEDYEELAQVYIEAIQESFKKNFLKGIKVVLDCANGATYDIAPELFAQFGAQVITISNTPNGKNINENCGSIHPENLQKEVVKQNADIGFAFDGDGDRIVAVNKQGQLKDGDDILCLLADNPDYKDQSHLVGTVFTNYGLEAYLNTKNKKLIRTKVGDKFVAKILKDENLLLGGEPSGHIITRNHINASDGIFTALKVLETILITKNWELKTFKKFPHVMVNVPVKQKKNLELQPFSSIIATHKAQIKKGTLVVRYSGTENLLRVMVQEENDKTAQTICAHLSEKLKVELDRI